MITFQFKQKSCYYIRTGLSNLKNRGAFTSMSAQINRSRDFKLIIAYILVLLLSLFFPLFYFLSVILVPIPLIVYAFRSERQSIFLIVGAVGAITLLFSIALKSLLFLPLFIVFTFAGLASALAIHKGKTAYETWISGIIGYIVSLLLIFIFTQVFLEINWPEEIRSATDQSINNISSLITQLDPSLSEQFASQLETVKEQLYYIPNLIPAGIAILAVLFSFLSQWLSYKLINKLYKANLSFPPIRKLNFPRALVFIYFIGFLFMMIESDPTKGLFIVGQNITSLMFFLILIQGISFLYFFTHFKKQASAIPLVIMIISFLIPFLLYIIHFLGLFDLALSLKERIRANKKG